jgi:hypothetical protein
MHWEIRDTLRPLLEAYRIPEKFFREIAPRFAPDDFSFPVNDWPTRNEQRLASTLRTWGHCAHLNPAVEAAFKIAARDPRMLARIIAQAERRRAAPKPDGRPPGSHNQSPRPRRANPADLARLSDAAFLFLNFRSNPLPAKRAAARELLESTGDWKTVDALTQERITNPRRVADEVAAKRYDVKASTVKAARREMEN